MVVDVKSLPALAPRLSFDLPTVRGLRSARARWATWSRASSAPRSCASPPRCGRSRPRARWSATSRSVTSRRRSSGFRAALEEAVERALEAGETNYPPVRRRPGAAQGGPEALRGAPGTALPAGEHHHRGRCATGDLRVLPHPGRSRRHGGLSGAVVEQQSLRAPLRGARASRSRRGPRTASCRPPRSCARICAARACCRSTARSIRPARDFAPPLCARSPSRWWRRTCAASARAPASGPLYLLYDHIYWYLASDAAPHSTPVALVPEVAPYTLFVDGISKGFAATGLRVGWAGRRAGGDGALQGPSRPRRRVGAAARAGRDRRTPRRPAAPGWPHPELRGGLNTRLEALYAAWWRLRAEGLPVDALPPAGALYLSVRFDLGRALGLEPKRSASCCSRRPASRWCTSGPSVSPKTAAGSASIGAVSVDDIRAALGRVRAVVWSTSWVPGVSRGGWPSSRSTSRLRPSFAPGWRSITGAKPNFWSVSTSGIRASRA